MNSIVPTIARIIELIEKADNPRFVILNDIAYMDYRTELQALQISNVIYDNITDEAIEGLPIAVCKLKIEEAYTEVV